MAVVSVAFDGTRLSEAESESDGGTWDKWGAGQSPAQDVDFPYQLGASSACIANKLSGTTGGIDFDSTGTNDYTTGPKVVLAQVNVTTFGLINTAVHKGAAYQVGSSGSDYYEYYIFGSKRDYEKARGGWVILAIDPNEAGYRAATVGTPALGSVNYYGWWADITDSVKSDNVMHDSLSYLTVGDGLTLTAGTSTDPEGTFQDFVDSDEGTVANRWGVVTSEEGALVVTGWLNIGTGAATEFDDTGAVVFWTETLTAEGFNGLLLDLGTAATVIQITDCFLQGNGRGFAKDFFNTSSDVNGTNETVALDVTKDWQDLDYVTYSKEGGTEAIGLTDATEYWIAQESIGNWKFYTSRDNAATDTSPVDLTPDAGDESHTILKHIDTRPDLTVSGTTGTSATITGTSIVNFRNITLTSKGELNTCKVTGADLLTQAGGTIDTCVFSGQTTESGEHLILATNPTLISDCDFTQGNAGHAVRCDSTGTYNWVGNTDSGYTGTRGTNLTSSSGSTSAMFYNFSGGLITLQVSGGGQSPSVRNGAGATTQVNNAKTITVSGVTEGAYVLVATQSTVAIPSPPETEGTKIVDEYADSTGTASASYAYTSDQPVHITAASAGVVIDCRSFDGAVYTDYTTEARERASLNDVLVWGSPTASGDYTYIAGLTTFDTIDYYVQTATAGGNAAWEFWNGSWTSFTMSGDNDFSSTGWKRGTFSVSGWTSTTVDSSGPYYFIRVGYTGAGGDTRPVLGSITVNVVKYITWESDQVITGDFSVTANWEVNPVA